MSIALSVLAALLVITLLVVAFLRTSPAQLASTIRLSGPLFLILAGAAFVVVGRIAPGAALLLAAAGWYGFGIRRSSRQRQLSKRSTVRTAAIEMELDHTSGGLEGLVLAGRHEGRVLGEMAMNELISFKGELSGDAESRQLLETYLDSRFPVWRENAKPDGRRGKGATPRPGSMTKQEAYKILGLETGATAADVRKAHRRLMQRLNPDLGGSSVLAARIDEAKQVLLSNHN